MKYNPELHHRHSIRLRDYDYANAGAYFLTACLNQRMPKIMAKQSQNDVVGQPQGVAPTRGMAIDYDFPTFGTIENDVMILNDAGKMIQQIWNEIPENYKGIKTGEFVIMPDHVHGIIEICGNDNMNNVGATPCGCPAMDATDSGISLPHLMDCFKTMTTNKYIQGVKQKKWVSFSKKLWQRNYYERMIRNDIEYAKIAEYIYNNPVLWGKKCLDGIL